VLISYWARLGCDHINALYKFTITNLLTTRTASAKKSPFSRTVAHIFVSPGDAPCDYHAICCMDEKTIQCLSNPSQHVSTYLQQFPSYSNRKCQNRRFHVPQPTFLFPLETPLRLSRNMLHGWKENSMLTNCLAACAHLCITVSEIQRDICEKNRHFIIHPCIRPPPR